MLVFFGRCFEHVFGGFGGFARVCWCELWQVVGYTKMLLQVVALRVESWVFPNCSNSLGSAGTLTEDLKCWVWLKTSNSLGIRPRTAGLLEWLPGATVA